MLIKVLLENMMGEDEVKLRDIFIGKSDGLIEANRNDFEKFFYKGNSSYHSLVSDNTKFIISGRKGTGKTILAKYYEKEQIGKGTVTEFINSNDILLSQLKEIDKDIESYELTTFIKFVIVFEMAKLIVNNKTLIISKAKLIHKLRVKKQIKKLESFIKERNCSENYKLKEFSKERTNEYSISLTPGKIKKKTILGDINGKSLNTENKLFEKSPYYYITEGLEKFVLNITKHTSISLIFDDLDEYAESIVDNKGFQQLLIKFINISHDINSKFSAKDNKSRVIVVIRSDILENLQSNSSNLNKILSDCQIKINWITNDDTSEDNELVDLILTKIKNSSDTLKNLPCTEIFERFFPKQVNNKSTYNYLINMGHGRPRDIIDMLNIIKNKYGECTKFEEYMFNKVQKDYSKNFKDSLKNEMSLYYDSKVINECFKLITFMKKDQFVIDDVVNTLDDYKSSLRNIESGMEFIEISYQFGLIGNRIKHEGKNLVFFKYREDGHELADVRARFIVHNGLKRTLL